MPRAGCPTYSATSTSSRKDAAEADDDDAQVREIVSLWEDRIGLLNEIQREMIDERIEQYGIVRLLSALKKMLGSNGHSINYLDKVLANPFPQREARASPGSTARDNIDWQAERDKIEAARHAAPG